MNKEYSLESFLCALSSNCETHFAINSISLANCGHNVCKSCIPGNIKSVECALCGELSYNNDLCKTETSSHSKIALQEYICGTFKDETNLKLEELKSNY